MLHKYYKFITIIIIFFQFLDFMKQEVKLSHWVFFFLI